MGTKYQRLKVAIGEAEEATHELEQRLIRMRSLADDLLSYLGEPEAPEEPDREDYETQDQYLGAQAQYEELTEGHDAFEKLVGMLTELSEFGGPMEIEHTGDDIEAAAEDAAWFTGD
jgi:hypothetical protein